MTQQIDEDFVTQIVDKRLDYLLGIQASDSTTRRNAMIGMQSVMDPVTQKDLEFLRTKREEDAKRDDQIKSTLGDMAKQFVSPIIAAAAAAVVSWLSFHKS